MLTKRYPAIFSVLFVFWSMFMGLSSFAQTVFNESSVEISDDMPISDVIESRYFKITPTQQSEIKNLTGFLKYKNETENIQCNFYKDSVPDKVKLVLASGSVWENNAEKASNRRPLTSAHNSEQPKLNMRVRLNHSHDSIDLICQITDKTTGLIDSARQEEQLRSQCEAKRGIFTRFSRKDYDYACDYKLKYSDLKKLFRSNGLSLEVRNEPPEVAVMVLGVEKTKRPIKKKATRLPSSTSKKNNTTK